MVPTLCDLDKLLKFDISDRHQDTESSLNLQL